MTTTETAAAVPTTSVLTRAIGMIFSPGATFKDVVLSPRPAGILLLVCLVMGLSTGLPQFTERGRQAALDMQVQQIEKFTGQPVSPAMYGPMEQRSHYSGYITMASIFVIMPVICVLMAAVYWVVFNALLGGMATFKQVLAILTHSSVITALGALVAAPIQYVQGVQSAAGPFNLGALAPMLEPGSVLATILGALSVFTIWSTIVTAVGLGVLYKRRSGAIAVALLTVYVLFVSLFSIGFSRIFGR